MGEILPDRSIQGYTGICPKCGKSISVNIQGNLIKDHKCVNNARHKWSGKRSKARCLKCGCLRDKSHIPPIYHLNGKRFDSAPVCNPQIK